MKSREADDMVGTYTENFNYIKSKGFAPKLNITDNECSKTIQEYIQSQHWEWQLAESNNHLYKPLYYRVSHGR